ncbi:succinyl-diaminopimelate desuccinylase [Anaplasmataceae bacterium AB001_6]|nr:succinyl-diaminopimelate desuccinylase [Anaplasmataceae bacterium AB001_6]
MNVDLLKYLIDLKTLSPDSSDSILNLIPILENMNFKVTVIEKNNFKNLYCVINEGKSKNLCFAGHMDVVDPIDQNKWKNKNPFLLHIEKNICYGRGVVDMKGSIFCFLEAVKKTNIKDKTISIILTSDEETNSKNGMPIVIEWLKEKKKIIDLCLVGEPTSENYLGDVIKTGRRGSITFKIRIIGKAGHVAYQKKCINPVNVLDELISKIKKYKIDDGNDFFEPSNCEIVGIKSNTNIENIIPETIDIISNIRFNNVNKSSYIVKKIEEIILSISDKMKLEYNIEVRSEPFVSKIKKETIELIKNCIKKTTQRDVKIINNGGTSDARFIKNYAPVIEIGLHNESAHKIDENCKIKDLEDLIDIYSNIIESI